MNRFSLRAALVPAHAHCGECGSVLTQDPESHPWAFCAGCAGMYADGVAMPVIEWPSSFPALAIRVDDFDWDQPIPDPPSRQTWRTKRKEDPNG